MKTQGVISKNTLELPVDKEHNSYEKSLNDLQGLIKESRSMDRVGGDLSAFDIVKVKRFMGGEGGQTAYVVSPGATAAQEEMKEDIAVDAIPVEDHLYAKKKNLILIAPETLNAWSAPDAASVTVLENVDLLYRNWELARRLLDKDTLVQCRKKCLEILFQIKDVSTNKEQLRAQRRHEMLQQFPCSKPSVEVFPPTMAEPGVDFCVFETVSVGYSIDSRLTPTSFYTFDKKHYLESSTEEEKEEMYASLNVPFGENHLNEICEHLFIARITVKYWNDSGVTPLVLDAVDHLYKSWYLARQLFNKHDELKECHDMCVSILSQVVDPACETAFTDEEIAKAKARLPILKTFSAEVINVHETKEISAI